MRRVRRFLRLSVAERWLLLEAALLLGGIKLGLWLLPFQTLRRSLEKLAKATSGLQKADRLSVERVAWAVKLAGHHMPRARTCLTQALATQFLLVQRGHQALIHIGVVREEGREFLAHA